MPNTEPGAFARTARSLFDLGLAPIPTGGDDGKKPLTTGYNRKPYGPNTISQLAFQFMAANAGVVCGLSHVVVVDIDEPDLLDPMLRRFDKTPLIIKTGGRGGYQAYYRDPGNIRPRDLRKSEGLAVEIKAAGSIVVVPPSINFKTGRPYTFHAGDFSVLPELPRFNAEALGQVAEERPQSPAGRVGVGGRSKWLLSACLQRAPHCDDLNALLDVARTISDDHLEKSAAAQFTDAEIVKAATQAWKYQQEGRNWVGQKATQMYTADLPKFFGPLPHGMDALGLYLLLSTEHAARLARGDLFRLVIPAMVEQGTIPGWTADRFRNAMKTLATVGLLECVHQGTGRGNPSLFTLHPFEPALVPA
jgi:hypothetical protein